MTGIRIVAGRKYEVMSDERRESVTHLAEGLRSSGIEVDLEIIEYEPGRRGLTPVEWTLVFIGTTAGTTIITNITNDIYQAVKKSLIGRWKAHKERNRQGRTLGFIIYDSENHEIARWDTREIADDNDSEE